MNPRKITFLLLIVSFLLSVSLGMMDYETESLTHLFTSDRGNLVALLIYTLFFTALGWIVVGVFRGAKKRMEKM